MSLLTKPTSVMSVLVIARVVNRLGGAGMGFLGVRLTRDLGVPLATTATVLALFGACTIPSRVLGGLVATRWGSRAALVGGLSAAGAAQAVVAVGPSLAVVVQGLSWGIATVVAPLAGGALLAHGERVLWLTGAAVTAALAVGHARPPGVLRRAISTR